MCPLRPGAPRFARFSHLGRGRLSTTVQQVHQCPAYWLQIGYRLATNPPPAARLLADSDRAGCYAGPGRRIRPWVLVRRGHSYGRQRTVGLWFGVQRPIAADSNCRDQATQAIATLMPDRILIVDDRRGARSVLTTLLSRMGQHVTKAENGAAARHAARSFHPDIVFCDIGLPDLDGYAVVRAMREQTGADRRRGCPHRAAVSRKILIRRFRQVSINI